MEGTSGEGCPSPPCRHKPHCRSLIEREVRRRLLTCVPQLAEYLRPDARFYNCLTSYSIITKHDKQRILGAGDVAEEEQIHRLMELLLRKSWSHLRAFCRFCYSEDHGDVIREVLGLDEDAGAIPRYQATQVRLLAASHTPGSSGAGGLAYVQNFLHKRYRQQYRNHQVLDNRVLDMFVHYLPVHLYSTTRNSVVSEDTLFESGDSSDPFSRVLVMGNTGTGKSSLCLHVAVTWAKKLSFQQFDLVLLLPSASVVKYGIMQSISLMFPHERLKTSIEEFMEESAEKCLIIIDDIDAILLHTDSDKKAEIRRLLSGGLFPDCHVLATTKFELPQRYLSDFDHRLEHSGFGQDKVNVFISNYFKKDSEKSCALLEFLNDHEDDSRTIEDLTQTPLWLLVLCRVWELQERSSVILSRTKLYSCIERNRQQQKNRLRRHVTKQDLRQLYQLSLFCVVHKQYLLKKDDLAGFSKTSIIFDFFLKRSYVNDDLEEPYGYILPQRSLLLFFAAREISELKPDWQAIWILINALLGDEENIEIASFLAGLLRIPNFLDLLLAHELFRESVDFKKLKGDCVPAMTDARDMMKHLVSECKSCLKDPTVIKMEEICILSQQKLRRQSFAVGITDKNSLEDRIQQMVGDVLDGICSTCLTRLFHHVLQRYQKTVSLLRCQYETMAAKNDLKSDFFKKLNRHHNKCIYLGSTNKSPYDFLISHLRKDDMRLEVKIPYASALPHLRILVSYLRKVHSENLGVQKLKIKVDLDWKMKNPIVRTLDSKGKNSEIIKSCRECLTKLYKAGLCKVAIHGFDPSISASLLPSNHPETLDAITLGCLDENQHWAKALSHFSHIRVDCLRFKSLVLDMTKLASTLSQRDFTLEDVGSLQLGHSSSITRAMFHQLVVQCEVNIMLEHPIIEKVNYGEFKLVYDPITTARDIYLSFAEQNHHTIGLLPAGMCVNKLRVTDIYTRQNLSALLDDLSLAGTVVSDLMISHTYMSGFILEELSDHKERLHENISKITIKHGTYQASEINEFLLMQNFTLSCGEEIRLDAPCIDKANLDFICLRIDPQTQELDVHIAYHSGSPGYIPLLPSSLHLHSLSLSGLYLDQQHVVQAIHADVSQCRVDRLIFQFTQYMAGDKCVENLLQNMVSWQQTVSCFVLSNCYLHTTEMVDLLSLADVMPLALEGVEMGNIKFRNVHFYSDPLRVRLECQYPQNFTDLLPASHQITHLEVILYSDYAHSVGASPIATRVADFTCNIFRSRSSRKQCSPSSVPRSYRRSNGSTDSSGSFIPMSYRRSNSSNDSLKTTSTDYMKTSNDSVPNSSRNRGSSGVSGLSPRGSSDDEKRLSGSFIIASPLKEDLDEDFVNARPPFTSSPLPTHQHSGSLHSKSCQSNSLHGSSVKTDVSARTQPDGADTLMLELEKSVIAEVVFDLTSASPDTCEDILQGLSNHGIKLMERITRPVVKYPSTVTESVINTYSNTLIGLCTKLICVPSH